MSAMLALGSRRVILASVAVSGAPGHVSGISVKLTHGGNPVSESTCEGYR
jgi:hypothetical protein